MCRDGARIFTSAYFASLFNLVCVHWRSIVICLNHLKHGKSQIASEALVDVMKRFPSYDLQSKEGSEMAIRDIHM